MDSKISYCTCINFVQSSRKLGEMGLYQTSGTVVEIWIARSHTVWPNKIYNSLTAKPSRCIKCSLKKNCIIYNIDCYYNYRLIYRFERFEDWRLFDGILQSNCSHTVLCALPDFQTLRGPCHKMIISLKCVSRSLIHLLFSFK